MGFLTGRPGVFCSVQSRSSQWIADGLVTRKLDVGLISSRIDNPYIVTEPLMEHPLVCIMARDHRLARKRAIRPTRPRRVSPSSRSIPRATPVSGSPRSSDAHDVARTSRWSPTVADALRVRRRRARRLAGSPADGQRHAGPSLPSGASSRPCSSTSSSAASATAATPARRRLRCRRRCADAQAGYPAICSARGCEPGQDPPPTDARELAMGQPVALASVRARQQDRILLRPALATLRGPPSGFVFDLP